MLFRLPFVLLLTFFFLLTVYCTVVFNRAVRYDRRAGTVSKIEGLRSCGFTPIKPHLDSRTRVTTSRPYSWPWTIALCGPASVPELSCTSYGLGSVVGRRWVLSRYMAYPPEVVGLMNVRTGVYSWINGDEPGSRLYNITKIHTYPLRLPDDPECAISLVELVSEIEYNDHVQPVCLSVHDHLLQNNRTGAWVSGWRFSGDYVERNMSQWHISAVKNFLPVIHSCYASGEAHLASMEAGAPLVKRHGQRWFQYGSVGLDMGYAAAFARLSYYCDWISKTTQGEVKCTRKMELDELI